jgi:hypothetical protein
MKRFFQILVWKFPKPIDLAVRVICGIIAVSMLAYGVIMAIKGDSGEARAYLLLGLMCSCGMLARRAT